MLAARDQENLLHMQHTVAANKPLNQSARLLPPKTPRNNENAVGGVKTGKAAKPDFITPGVLISK